MSDPDSPNSLRVVTNVDQLRTAVCDLKALGGKVGLVPTMGALHEGHLSLVRRSRSECRATIVTIFVNPTQFGPREDLGKYPRTMNEDLAMLAAERVDLVFAPEAQEIYPSGFSTFVEPPAVAAPLEGLCRPGHFRGVATVVLKLFQLIPAHVAYFGQKDYQQFLVIQHMVRDLGVDVELCMCPIVREKDGLALSSRNRYLSAEGRRQAVAISRALFSARELIEGGQRNGALIRERMRGWLAAAGIARVDYAAVVDADSLAEVDAIPPRVALLIAAFVGETRLIDNCLIE